MRASRIVVPFLLLAASSLVLADEVTPPIKDLSQQLLHLWQQKPATRLADKQREIVDAALSKLTTPSDKIQFLKLGSHTMYVQLLLPEVYVPYASAFLNDPDAGVQAEALRGLQFFRNRTLGLTAENLPRIKELTQSTDLDVQSLALAAYGGAAKLDAIDKLNAVIASDADARLRCGALNGLTLIALDPNTPAETQKALVARFKETLSASKESLVRIQCLHSASAITSVKTSDPQVHADAVALVGANLNNRQEERNVRTIAAETLGIMCCSPELNTEAHMQAVSLLQIAARNSDELAVRVAALSALARPADNPTIDPVEAARLTQIVCEFIDDKDSAVRTTALGKIRELHKHVDTKTVLPAVLKIASITTNGVDVRSAAIYAAAALGDESTIPTIAAWLKDKESNIRIAAMNGLVQLNARDQTPAIAALLATGDHFERWNALRALHELRAPDFAAIAKPLLDDPDQGIRDAAKEYLAR